MNQGTDREPGGSKFSVRHRTEFAYSEWIVGNANTVHLEPGDSRFQETLGCIIRILPPTRLTRSHDPFGNITHAFEIATQHRRMVVESHLRVITLPLVIPNGGYSGGMGPLGSPEIREACLPYLHESPWVSVKPDMREQAADVSGPHDAVFEKAAAIMRWIHAGFSYEPGTTDAETHMEQAFSLRKGVCQDFAHVMIGMCRSLGIPARYASGYIYTGEKDVLVGAQASHAWCEVFLPEAGWTGFDPTNSVLADDRYIRVAAGRDYGDVAPIHGSYRGNAHCTMEVTVSVERI